MADIQIQNLTFTYPGRRTPALANICFTAGQGEYILLCGQSGSGKTTLLRHLKTVLTPYGARTGRVLLDGRKLETVPNGEQARRIGFVMQSPDDQIVTDKVWHELAFGLESLGEDSNTIRLRVAEMASFFGIQNWFGRDTSELSGGQKQLLNLAAVMVTQPEILILDEPTSQLDPIAASDFLNTVGKINTELGTTVLMTEHRLEDIFPRADRVVVMSDGRITAEGSPRQVCTRLWERQDPMLEALPSPARAFLQAGSEGPCPLTVREGRQWLEQMFRSDPPERVSLPEKPQPQSGQYALRIRNAWFRYEKNAPDVLKGADLAVPAGSLYAIVGGNGTGKSTLLKVACGVCKLYRGRVELLGKPLAAYPRGQAYREGIAMLPQDPRELFVAKTLEEDLAEMKAAPEERATVAAMFRVEDLLDCHPYDLSGGELQRAALAKVLLTRPKVLLLDEPTKGLDSSFKRHLAELLRKLTAGGTTVVMVSHDVEFCAEYADLVGMFFNGQILAADTPRRFFGQNSFYTTAANRMSRSVFRGAITAENVAALVGENRGAEP